MSKRTRKKGNVKAKAKTDPLSTSIPRGLDPDELAELRARADQGDRRAESVVFIAERASHGDIEAQYHLGNLFRDGGLTRYDPPEALGWYKRAAERGHAGAQCCLGKLYEAGAPGVVASREQARFWYEKSSSQGNEEAAEALKCISSGSGTRREGAPSTLLPTKDAPAALKGASVASSRPEPTTKSDPGERSAATDDGWIAQYLAYLKSTASSEGIQLSPATLRFVQSPRNSSPKAILTLWPDTQAPESPFVSCSACGHYREKRSVLQLLLDKLDDRSMAMANYALSLSDREFQREREELALRARLENESRSEWGRQPVCLQYCGRSESKGSFGVCEVVNKKNDCEFFREPKGRRECDQCRFRRDVSRVLTQEEEAKERAFKNSQDMDEMAVRAISSLAWTTPASILGSTARATEDFHRAKEAADRAITLQRVRELQEATQHAGYLARQPNFLPFCAVASAATGTYALCCVVNHDGRCPYWDPARGYRTADECKEDGPQYRLMDLPSVGVPISLDPRWHVLQLSDSEFVVEDSSPSWSLTFFKIFSKEADGSWPPEFMLAFHGNDEVRGGWGQLLLRSIWSQLDRAIPRTGNCLATRLFSFPRASLVAGFRWTSPVGEFEVCMSFLRVEEKLVTFAGVLPPSFPSFRTVPSDPNSWWATDDLYVWLSDRYDSIWRESLHVKTTEENVP